MIQKVKGTKDYYPKDKHIQNYIFNIWKTTSKKFGYEEIDAPIIEPLELYTKKSGAEIESQLYSFTDKGGRKLALRPELTPSIARMIAQDKSLKKPLRWFSIPRCYRYEQPQSGRQREFFQFNLDLLGIDSIKADAEVIATAVEMLKAFGLTEKDFIVKISSRKLIKNKSILPILDKKDKLTKEEFQTEIGKLSKPAQKDINSLLKEKIKDKELGELFTYLKEYGIDKFCEIDPTVVRGLDYYTGIVFEIRKRKGKLRAIAGGGRYENLVETFGGEKCPGVGYGMGEETLTLLLEQANKLPDIKKEIDFFIATIGVDGEKIATKLRKKYSIELNLTDKPLAKQIKYAESIKAKNVVIIGEEEIKTKKLTIKNLETGKQEKKGIDDI